MLHSASLFLEFQIALNVLENEESFLLEELIEVEWTLGVVDLLLKHLTQVFNVDV